jgi:hypothetical protein
MIRGTTHTIKFDCIDIIDTVDAVQEIEISIDQENKGSDNITRLYSANQCYIDDETKIISTVLTPDDTLSFHTKKKATVQLRVVMLDHGGQPYTLGNYIQMITVYPTQRNFVLGGGSNG